MKWTNISLICVSGLLSSSLWFSASTVVPQLTLLWGLNGSQQALLTTSVLLGFVIGTLTSAFLNLADRLNIRKYYAGSVLAGALFNAAIPYLGLGFSSIVLFRFLTGATLAASYPLGMKLITTWCKKDRGTGLGLFIGVSVFGNAIPHLLNTLWFTGDSGMPPWGVIMYMSSGLAFLSFMIVICFIKAGPFLSKTAPFNWKYAIKVLSYKPTRYAIYGYLGHMWEFFAMYTWVPLLLITVYDDSGLSKTAARMAGFSTIAIGLFGCLIAGITADLFGRTKVTIWSLVLSGSCALSIGFLLSNHVILTVVCLVWGFTVVSDSAQFSAAISELTDSRYIGTALTVQTSLGFLLTVISIQIIPRLVEMLGWEYAFIPLVFGPLFGIYNMSRLRKLPESIRMASGNR